MRQVAQNYRSGELVVLDVPPPACKPGGVLVRTTYSLISTGTELMKVSEARLSLLGKARARPDQVRKVLDTAVQQGPVATYRKAMSKLDSYTPLGYSLCGVVVEVGSGAEEFAVGDVVAAAGNEFALHAELNWIPTNLCVPVPTGVVPEHAAFATVGAIAMQGVRRAEVQLGETACVIGLGLIGQLVVRLLVASGVRVVGVDTVPDRCRMAEAAGAVACAGADDEGTAYLEQVLDTTTGGIGADHIFLAAGGGSNGPVELAARLARDRARVVDIGKTRLDLPWNAYYEKELDVRFSRSYGPGRYDDRYELQGIDYPVGYVRWTERRNLQCFLDLLVEGLDGGRLPRLRHPSRRRCRGRLRASCATEPSMAWDISSSTTMPYAAEPPVPTSRFRPAAPQGRCRSLRAGPHPATSPPQRRTAGKARCPRLHLQRAGARLHRCGQLRHVNAPAALGGRPHGHVGHGGDHAFPVRRQCTAEVRLRRGHDRCPRRPRRPGHRRRLRRHAPSLPRRLRVPCARGRQGGLRGEALGAHSIETSTESSRSSNAPATIGSWSASTAASPHCSPCSASDSARWRAP